MSRKLSVTAPVALSFSLFISACGSYTPFLEYGEDVQGKHVTGSLVNEIVAHVKCELGRAVLYEIDRDVRDNKGKARSYPWLDNFVGTLTLTMTVDEKSGLAPGATWTDPLPTVQKVSQSFGLGIGAAASADATRKQQIDFVFDVKKDFIDDAVFRGNNDINNKVAKCESGQPLIEGDLRIQEWLDSALLPRSIGYLDSNPPDVLTDDITFIVSYSGSLTPSWKLVRWSVNSSSPFATASRIRTNEALIVLGPPGKTGAKGKAVASNGPSDTVIEFRNIALIGSALNISLKTQ